MKDVMEWSRELWEAGLGAEGLTSTNALWFTVAIHNSALEKAAKITDVLRNKDISAAIRLLKNMP